MKQNGFDINNDHRRVLGSALKITERTLNEFVLLIKSALDSAITPLSPQRASMMLRKIEDVRKQIRDFRSLFNIHTQRQSDPIWTLRVGSARMWEMLEDCKSASLRGYGEVSASSRATLDGKIQNLIDLIQSIADDAALSRKD